MMGGEKLPERDSVYDWVRVFATLLVVIGHSSYLENITRFGGVSYSLPDALSPAYYSAPLTFLRNSVDWIYSFHMPLFFMLSGAVLALKPPESLIPFAGRKIRRLLLPYYACGLLFVLPVRFLTGYYERGNVLKAAMYFLVGAESSHLWFLLVLFVCLMVFAVLYLVSGGGNRAENCLYLLPLALLISIAEKKGVLHIRFLGRIMEYFFWLLAGFVFGYYRKRIRNDSLLKTAVFTASLLLIELLAGKYDIELGSYAAVLLRSGLVFGVSLLCSLLFPRIVSSPVWKLIIRNLLNIYLFHDPLEYVILWLFMGGGWLRSAAGCWLFYVFRSAGTILLSIVIGELLRRFTQLFAKRTKPS